MIGQKRYRVDREVDTSSIPFPDPAMGMWQVRVIPGGRIEVLQWTQATTAEDGTPRTSIVKFEFAQEDTAKFAAALMFRQGLSLHEDADAQNRVWFEFDEWYKTFVSQLYEELRMKPRKTE